MEKISVARVSVGILFALTGCLDDDQFIGPLDGDGVFRFALTETTTPVAGELLHVETRIALPLEPPTAEEFGALNQVAPVPYGRQPWLLNGELALEVDVAVKNLDAEARTFVLAVDGFSEFHEYVPGYVIEIENGQEEVTPNPSQWERNVLVEANGTYTVTVRQEHLDEAAVDLATIANGAPNPNQVNFRDNHSSRDARAQPFIPDPIAGLVGFRLGLLHTGPANLVVEASLRVRDREGRLADVDDPTSWWPLPTPQVFTGLVPEP